MGTREITVALSSAIIGIGGAAVISVGLMQHQTLVLVTGSVLVVLGIGGFLWALLSSREEPLVETAAVNIRKAGKVDLEGNRTNSKVLYKGNLVDDFTAKNNETGIGRADD